MTKAVAISLFALALTGCSSIQRTPPTEVWPDMKHQARFRPQLDTSTYPELAKIFSDGRQTRPLPEGVVAHGRMREENPSTTGMDGKLYVGKMPIEVTEEVLSNGQAQFNIYCAPCHDRTGLGKGMVPLRVPTWQPANLTEDRLVQAADGDLFNVITYGRRTMPPYYDRVSVENRWHIVAYVRLLQRAAHGVTSDVPEEQRPSLAYKGAN
jgi:mono/diheme cytochrome c family protein